MVEFLSRQIIQNGHLQKLIDELHDPVGLLANESRERPVLVAERGFEQLSSASNTRKRVFNLVRQHRSKRGDRASGAAMGQLPVHFFSN